MNISFGPPSLYRVIGPASSRRAYDALSKSSPETCFLVQRSSLVIPRPTWNRAKGYERANPYPRDVEPVCPGMSCERFPIADLVFWGFERPDDRETFWQTFAEVDLRRIPRFKIADVLEKGERGKYLLRS